MCGCSGCSSGALTVRSAFAELPISGSDHGSGCAEGCSGVAGSCLSLEPAACLLGLRLLRNVTGWEALPCECQVAPSHQLPFCTPCADRRSPVQECMCMYFGQRDCRASHTGTLRRCGTAPLRRLQGTFTIPSGSARCTGASLTPVPFRCVTLALVRAPCWPAALHAGISWASGLAS